VLHHLDLVQIGLHKLHFFDESLLAGAVGDLEHTVFNEYEMTMLAPRAPASRPGGAAACAGGGRRRPVVHPRDPPPGRRPRRHAGTAGAPAADAGALALQEVGRVGRGRIVALDRANTMIGEYGAETALIVKRGQALFLSRFAGLRPPRLNGAEVGPGAHVIGEHDRIEIGAEAFEVIRLRDDPGANTGT